MYIYIYIEDKDPAIWSLLLVLGLGTDFPFWPPPGPGVGGSALAPAQARRPQEAAAGARSCRRAQGGCLTPEEGLNFSKKLMLWSDIPDRATASYTSEIPQHDIGNH